MAVTTDQRIRCLELATSVTSRNKTEAMKVAQEFIDFVDADEMEKQADKVAPRRGPRKAAGKTADGEAPKSLV